MHEDIRIAAAKVSVAVAGAATTGMSLDNWASVATIVAGGATAIYALVQTFFLLRDRGRKRGAK